ncbi:MAG: PLP-dependent aminotransferase family protein [Anaerolineae bacterium]|nr:PLP-dependent aminotransferase family protein [Anaerolineae bacterium]
MTSSAIRELLKVAARPEVISFGGGMPAPELFPREEVSAATERVLKNPELANQALQYGTTEGLPALREWIASFMSKDGLEVNPDNVLITSGSQQALDLLGKIFIDENDYIVVENPTYLGALQAWAPYGAEYATVPMDQDGMITDALPHAFAKNPKFIYALSNFQNPTGVSMSLERRQKLVELSTKYQVPIVEDDPYGALCFEAVPTPSLLAIESQYENELKSEPSNVVYLSTFSKILTPGLRLAWVIAPDKVINKMVQAKQGMDLHTTTFAQCVAYEVARTGFLDGHIQKIIECYRRRRDVMLESLEENMPVNKGITWTNPQGGLFLWITMPEHINTTRLLEESLKDNVAFVPGDSFFPLGGGKNTMRLNFSYMPDAKINEGIGRLSQVVKRML